MPIIILAAQNVLAIESHKFRAQVHNLTVPGMCECVLLCGLFILILPPHLLCRGLERDLNLNCFSGASEWLAGQTLVVLGSFYVCEFDQGSPVRERQLLSENLHLDKIQIILQDDGSYNTIHTFSSVTQHAPW